MKFSPQELIQLIEFRSRMFLAVQEFSKNPTDFDTVLVALWKLESVSREYTLMIAPYYQSNRVLDYDGLKLIQLAMGAVALKKLQATVKEANAVMQDKHTFDAYKQLFAGSPVIGLSAPVAYGRDLNTGGDHCKTVNGRFFGGEVKSYERVTYTIEFSDHTKLEWHPPNTKDVLDNIKEQFNHKIAELAEVKKLRM